MYYTLVLALPLCAYAAAPDYLGAHSNIFKASNMLEARLNTMNKENINHVILAGAILKVADAVTNAEYLYPYIYETIVEEAIREARIYPEHVATACNYRIFQSEAVSMKAQTLVEDLCFPKLQGASAQCNEAVDEELKKNKLQQVGDLLLALGDAGYVYLGLAPEFDEAAKRNTVLRYLRNGKGRLRDLVMKIANVNKNL